MLNFSNSVNNSGEENTRGSKQLSSGVPAPKHCESINTKPGEINKVLQRGRKPSEICGNQSGELRGVQSRFHCDESERVFSVKLDGGSISDTCTTNQQEAIRHKNGPCMVIAGPGSGKTFVITRRIQTLIKKYDVDPSKILVITFSKASALEMKERFLSLCGEEYYPVTFGTFHAIYFQIIKRAYQLDGNHIIKEIEKRNLIKNILETSGEDYIIDEDFIETILKEISIVKNEGISIHKYQSTVMDPILFQNIFLAYRKQMSLLRKVDFDDMVLLTYELLSKRKDIREFWQDMYEYVLVDEFQDINQMQFQVMKMLVEKTKNLFVVGDDDQSIYGFRGAKPEIMLSFEQIYPGCHKVLLDQNFRSDGQIVRCALSVINQNKIRFEKDIKPSKGGNEKAVELLAMESEEAEFSFICERLLEEKKKGTLSENAVLFRMNQQACLLAEKLATYRIPFSSKELSKSIYEHFIFKDFLAYYRLALGERDRALFFEIMNKPVRYIKREDVPNPFQISQVLEKVRGRSYVYEALRKLQYDLEHMNKMSPYPAFIYFRKAIGYEEYLRKLSKERGMNFPEVKKLLEELSQKMKEFSSLEELLTHVELYEAERKKAYEDSGQDAVKLMTMHSAKGLEWEKVYIPLANEGVIPSPKALTEKEIEEERRLFYVALTRAKNKLILLHDSGNQENPRFMSRFMLPMVQKTSKHNMDEHNMDKHNIDKHNIDKRRLS